MLEQGSRQAGDGLAGSLGELTDLSTLPVVTSKDTPAEEGGRGGDGDVKKRRRDANRARSYRRLPCLDSVIYGTTWYICCFFLQGRGGGDWAVRTGVLF